MSGCVMGCTQPDHHDPAVCLDAYAAAVWCVPACRGCAPVPVDVGWLCARCRGRLVWLLRSAGEQHAALLADLVPGRGAAHEPVSGSREPAAPLAIDPVAVAEDLARLLTTLVVEVLALHPEQDPPARLLTGAARHATDAAGGVYAVAPGTAGAWLAARVHLVASAWWVRDAYSRVVAVMGHAHQLAPLEAAHPQLVPCVPCPACHTSQLLHYQATDRAECLGCHHVLPGEHYRAWVHHLRGAIACA